VMTFWWLLLSISKQLIKMSTMKQVILYFTFLFFMINVHGQTPDPILTGVDDPGGLLQIGNDLYVSVTGAGPNGNRIIKVDLTDPVPVVSTVVVSGGGITIPIGMAQKGNYIYFCQYGNGFVSRFDWTLANPIVENVVTSGLSNPTSIAIVGDDLYVAETTADKVSKIDLTQSLPIAPTLFVGGLSAPWGLVNYGDTLLVSESGTPNVVGFDMTVVNPPRIAISTAGMNQPKGMSLDGSMLYIADDDANNISKIDLTQPYPIAAEVVTSVQHPQDVLAAGFDLFISEMGTDQVIRRLNTVALDPLIVNNPGNKYYTGFYNPHSNTISHRTPGWNNPLSWAPFGVPTPQSDVVALPVYGVDFTKKTTIRSITCSSNAFINIHADFEVLEPSVFNAPCYINWVSGTITGNTTITNHGQMNFTTDNMFLYDSITLINYGGMRFESVGNLYMRNSIIENKPSGEIKLDYPNTNIYHAVGAHNSGLIINEGVIRKTSSGTATIGVNTENINGGTIQTEIGNLTISGNSTFHNGIVNVAAGTTINWNYLGDVTLSGLFTGTLDGIMSFSSGEIIIPGSATIDFVGNNPIELYGTTITGGGVLNLQDDVSILPSGFTVVQLNSGTTVNNEAVFTLASPTNSFGIYESTFNNLTAGIIDIQAGNILRFQSTTEQLNNYGKIKRSKTTDAYTISANLHNAGGTIEVERGRLNLSNKETLLDGGVYDVDSLDNILKFESDITFLGSLTGIVNGKILISNHHAIVDSATTATFDFDGLGGIDCHGCNVSGKGTLINKSSIQILGGANMYISEGVKFNNEGEIFTAAANGLHLAGGHFYNMPNGVIDLRSDATITRFSYAPTLINSGLIKKSASTGISNISTPIYNTGTIEVDSGTLRFNDTLHNHSNSIIMGTGTIDLPVADKYINDGIYSPGASPGELTVIGDYESSGSAVLSIELNGLIQATDYDLITVQGASDVNGSIDVTLGFDPSIGDAFTILSSTDALTSTLPSTIVATAPNNEQYTFSVHKNPNTIVLEVVKDCTDNRELSGVSISGNYSAGLNLIATNIDVSAGAVFSAPTVVLNENVTVPLGQLLEINQLGCD